MRNKMTDLNNHLFAQLERLSDDDISQEDLSKEIQRSKAMTNVAQQIVENARNTIEVIKLAEKMGLNPDKHLENSFLKISNE